ncbi:response regulator [Thermoanaerobacterium thermosulfurigenes]|uniref:response regulator n=1 Tax=Thermoanaerobacterium thermosulfurigenes TaxID=33950 RepID=UPI003EF76C41
MSENNIKVFIIDDEYLERSLLKQCINWESLGMEIVGEASNANEGIKLIDELKPDIVFTDIKMPGIDGIEFSEFILKKHPSLIIIVLTGYNDFNYAQKSVKLGIFDFLLKPIDENEVLNTAKKVKSYIEGKKKEKKELEDLKKQLYENLPYLKERFLNELITSNLPESSINERLEFFKLHLKSGNFQIAAIEIANSADLNEESRLIQNFKVSNYVKSYFKKLKNIIVFSDQMNRIIILSNDEKIDLYKICMRLKNKINKELDCTLNIGIGNIKENIGEVRTSYMEAIDALNYHIAVGNNNIIHYRDVQFKESKSESDTMHLLNELKFYLKSGLEDDAINTVKEIFSLIDVKSENALKLIHVSALNIISVCFSVSLELKENFDDIYLSEINTYNKIVNIETLPEMIEFLSSIVINTIKAVNKEQISNINNLIDNVKKFIEENLSDSNLSLSFVAKHFYLNPSYLSRTFKKETGINFIEYLTNKRMEKAISLIKEKNMKSFEIANAVGIQDPNYFSSCFKKYTGLNVSEYKKLIKNTV